MWQPTPIFLPGESHGQGAWWAIVHRVTKSQTRLKLLSKRFKADVTVSGCQGPQISVSGDSAASRQLLFSIVQ